MLSAKYRLKNNRTFNYIYRKGKSVGGAYSVLLYTEARGKLLIGFSVSKKVGKSVTRNKIKRRMREAVRPLLPFIKSGRHIVFVAREGIKEASFDQLCKAIRVQLERADLLVQQDGNEIPLHTSN